MAVDATLLIRARPYAGLVVATVLAQIAYPLTPTDARADLTVVIVLLGAAASIVHAAVTRGARVAVVVAVTAIVGGFLIEVVGVHTGVPFGSYRYTSALGTSLFGVPLAIGPAWAMLAWPAALSARRLCRSFPARVALGAWALASWDVFLDPQMVAAGNWRWLAPDPHLPGVPSVPLTNYLGWLVAATMMSFVLQRVTDVPGTSPDDGWPLAFYVWTWASSTLALAAFLHLGAASAWGFAAMGVVAVPVARTLAGRR
jgi:putative membrane protein